MENENQLMSQQTAPVVFNFFDPKQFDTMQRLCKMFANSELVPDMYRATDKNPVEKAIANCMIALSISSRTGADPLMVMQNLIIIYGRPSWSSKFLIATVNTCGRFNPLKYKFTEKGLLGKVEYVEYEKVWDKTAWNGKGGYKTNAKKTIFDGSKIMDIECVAYTTSKGSNEILESSPVSLRMAIEEGWYTKSGSKWRTIPKQMLMYRTASFWTNAYAPELSMGMKTEDEVRDIVDAEYEDVTAKVEKEKEEFANKTDIGFEAEPQTDKETPKEEKVDTETGEVTDAKEPDKASIEVKAKNEQKLPGF